MEQGCMKVFTKICKRSTVGQECVFQTSLQVYLPCRYPSLNI